MKTRPRVRPLALQARNITSINTQKQINSIMKSLQITIEHTITLQIIIKLPIDNTTIQKSVSYIVKWFSSPSLVWGSSGLWCSAAGQNPKTGYGGCCKCKLKKIIVDNKLYTEFGFILKIIFELNKNISHFLCTILN